MGLDPTTMGLLGQFGINAGAVAAVIWFTSLVKTFLAVPDRWRIVIPFIMGGIVAIPATLIQEPGAIWYKIVLQAFIYACAAATIWKVQHEARKGA